MRGREPARPVEDFREGPVGGLGGWHPEVSVMAVNCED